MTALRQTHQSAASLIQGLVHHARLDEVNGGRHQRGGDASHHGGHCVEGEALLKEASVQQCVLGVVIGWHLRRRQHGSPLRCWPHATVQASQAFGPKHLLLARHGHVIDLGFRISM